MSAESVSKIDLILSLKEKALLNLELKRHLAPKTVGTIIRALPVEGNAHMMGSSIAFVDTNLNAGGEKLRNQFKKGDVSFMASNGSICFFLEDVPAAKSRSRCRDLPLPRCACEYDGLQTGVAGNQFGFHAGRARSESHRARHALRQGDGSRRTCCKGLGRPAG